MMSRIPKLNTVSEENNPYFMNRPKSRSSVNFLSDVDKQNLLENHTKPLRAVAGTSSRLTLSASTTDASTNSNSLSKGSLVAASRLKNSQSKLKVTKIKKKPAATTTKFPPYDFKGKYCYLLEIHKNLKNQFEELKDNHNKMSEDYENIKHERDILRDKFLNSLSELKEKSSKYEKLKIDYELQKLEIEELHRKLEFDHLEKHYIEHEKVQLDYEEAQKTIANIFDTGLNILAAMYGTQKDSKNTIKDLKGNIRLYCRIRPPLTSESSKLLNLHVLDACSIEVEKVGLFNCTVTGRRSIDGIFTPYSSQGDVFTAVSSMVQLVLDGNNVYMQTEQTGSGKTTMEDGSAEQYGILPRAFSIIFTYMKDLKKIGWELTIKAFFPSLLFCFVSFLLYNVIKLFMTC